MTEILNGLNVITGWIKDWAVLLAAIGALSMALLQTAKNLFPLRTRFQERKFRQWLNANARKSTVGEGPDAGDEKTNPNQPDVQNSNAEYTKAQPTLIESHGNDIGQIDPEQDLINLVASGNAKAFYDLPIEQLCDQIKSVASVILDYPELHRDLLWCLASQAEPSDVELVLSPPPPELFSKRADQSSEEEKLAVRKYSAAKTRLAVQVRCSVDAIQTSIGFSWKRWLQWASVILSAILGGVAPLLGVVPKHDFFKSVGYIIFVGLISGFLAPFSRDLVAAAEKWRS